MGRPLYFEELLNTLRSASSSATNRDFEQNLYYELEQAKPKFFQLFDIPPRNAKERQDIEAGVAKLPGRTTVSHFNTTFKNETLFLAQELDASELYCAELIDDVAVMDKFGRSATAESAVARLHDERACMLACLRHIFEAAMNPSGLSQRLGNILGRYAVELMTTPCTLGPGGEKGRLAEKLLLEVDRLKSKMERIRVSLLNAPTATNATSFGDSTLKFRLERVQHERRQLGHLLFIFSAAREMDRVGVTKMVRWLAAADRSDDLIYYILTAVLAAIDPNPDVENAADGTTGLINDRELMVQINSALGVTTWKVPGLKAVINLQWSLWVLEVRRQDPHIQGNMRGIEEDVEKIVQAGIKGDAFRFLTELVILSKSPTDDAEDLVAQFDQANDQEETMDPDFRNYFLIQLDTLVQSLIVNMSFVLKRIRTKEDDVEYAASRNMRVSTAADAGRRNDTRDLYLLIAVIFAEREPDAALKYWRDDGDYEGRLFAFLQWATEVKRPELTIALYEMLASLARGPACAMEAFNFLATDGGQYAGQAHAPGSCSWNTLFNALANTSDSLVKSRAPQVQTGGIPFGRRAPTSAPPGSLSPDEVGLFRSFLRLLRNVVRFSIPARDVIRDQQDFHALPTLFNIVAFPVALELKASLYDTLAAFCGVDGSPKSVETLRTMWKLLDQSGVLRDSNVALAGGAIVELEQIETPHKTYPATTSFLDLLNALVHCPKRQYSSTGIHAGISIIPTTPDLAGSHNRPSNIQPYIDFVVNDVILKAGVRGFRTQTERFRMLDSSVHFLEKCLASYDLSALRLLDLSPSAASSAAALGVQSPLAALVAHPGFDIMCRILVSDSPLRRELFMYVTQGYDAIEKNLAKTHYFNRTVRRVLQIIHRVLEIQAPFLDILLPYLAQNPAAPGLGGSLVPRGISGLDQYLIWSPELVPQIGLYVNRVEDQEMMLLAVNILSLISESPVFNVVDSNIPGVSRRMNRLVVLLDRHEFTPLIVEGFVRLLAVDPEATAITLEDTPVGDDVEEEQEVDLSDLLRSAIMQLLLRNTTPGRAAPNIAHLLLGFPLRKSPADMTISDPEAMGSTLSCLHTILNLLNVGIPRLSSGEDGDQSRTENTLRPLFERNPVFAEECYRLLYQLCVHDFTCTPTVRYLRTREDFFARHLAALPAKAPPTTDIKSGMAVYGDRGGTPSTRLALTAFLRLRAALLECVALELHVLSENRQPQRIGQLLELLFDAGSNLSHPTSATMGGMGVAQPLVQILEILESLDFEWRDSVEPQAIDLQVYQSVPFDSCLEANEDGCQVYSVPLVAAMVNGVKQSLLRQGGAMSDQQARRVEAESRFVLDSCVVENNRRLIEHAKQVSFVAWRHVLDISLHECFDRLPQGQREHITLDILQALPTYLSKANTTPFVATLLAELILSLSTKLREDRHHQLILQSTINDAFAASLPVDRIHAIFRTIIQCILSSGTSERFRGNLYAALTNFVHLVTSDGSSDPTAAGTSRHGAQLGLSFIADEPQRDANSLVIGGKRTAVVKRTALESGALGIVNMFVDRVVPIICRDAADGSEVWKTVAFTCLDALVQLSRVEKAHRVLNVMAREGFLKNFVHSLKTADHDMMLVLKPDPDNLNPLYVYEAKMALLTRAAQTRQGAERLLDCRVFGLLTHCEFLDARPQNDHAFLDFDSFLPSAIERYHQVIVPAVQLAVSILSAAGNSQVVSKQALDFVLAHRRTFLALLTDHWEQLTLAMLRELQLVVALCSFVIPSVDDLLVPAGFGAIHTAVLSLSARCMSPRRWRESVAVVNDAESQDAQTPARGYGKGANDSVWSEKVDAAASALQKWLAIYSMTVTEIKGDFKPVIAAVMTLTAEGESSSHIRNPVPTISDAIVALTAVLQGFSDAQAHGQELANKLDNPDQIAVDEIAEVTTAAYSELLDDLDMNQRRVLALRELGNAGLRSQREALELLHWLEVLLLLLWRHLDFFLSDPAHTASSQNGASLRDASSASRLGRSSVWGTGGTGGPRRGLREQCAEELLPVLDQLDDIELLPEIIGIDAAARKTFIQLVVRGVVRSTPDSAHMMLKPRLLHSDLPHVEHQETSSDARKDGGKARQSLFVDHINPTTTYDALHDLFEVFPGFSGLRMTRHSQRPVAFVQFDDLGAAIIAYQRLRQHPPLLEGHILDIRYARPRLPNPNDRPSVAGGSDFESSAWLEHQDRSEEPSVTPTASLFLRYRDKWPLPPPVVCRTISRMKNSQSVKLKKKMHTFLAFADFDSVKSAQSAMKRLSSPRNRLGNILVSYAHAPIQREASTEVFLHLRGRHTIEDLDSDLNAMEGLIDYRSLPRPPTFKDTHFVMTFRDEHQATAAIEYLKRKVPRSEVVTANFYHRRGVSNTPCAGLYLTDIPAKASEESLGALFSTYPGFERLQLAKAVGFAEHQQHAGWAIIEFHTGTHATTAFQALNGKRWHGSVLRLAYKSNHTSDAVISNKLFCRELYSATPDDLSKAFAVYDGFQMAKTMPDGLGGYMPYGIITFDTPSAASAVLAKVASKPLKIGIGELPVILEPLRLRNGTQHWKWGKGRAFPHSRPFEEHED